MDIQTPQVRDDVRACLAQLALSSGELHRKVSRFSDSERVHVTGDGDRRRVPYAEVVPLERRLEMIENISSEIKNLTSQGHRFRRAEARALYAEGLTMSQLAAVFGVSRQRVSALLRGAGPQTQASDAGGAGTQASAPGDGALVR